MARTKCVLTAVRSSSVTLPLVGHKVGQVVVEQHAGGPGVAPVVHLAAPGTTALVHTGSKDICYDYDQAITNVSFALCLIFQRFKARSHLVQE